MTSEKTTPADIPSPPEPTAAASPRRRKPRIWFWLLIGLALGGIVAVQATATAGATDHANANVATVVLGLVAVLTPACWFVFRSGYSRRMRYGFLIAGLVTVGLLSAALRIEQVSGELVPRFAFRWQARADWTLEKPAEHAGHVDVATTTPQDFPQFLGPQRNAAVTHVQLARDWQNRPPQRLWRIPIGAGWSSFAVVNGFAVTMEQRGDEELVTCYEVTTGQLQWSHGVQARHSTTPGGIGPRATPTVHQGRVYALGATGVLRCLDGATGDLVWTVDLLQQIGVTPDQDAYAVKWGRANSPLIVDDTVVVPVGGRAGGPCMTLAAYRLDNGQLVWTGGTRQASYSSPALATLCGVRQILIVCEDYVAAHRPEDGAALWEFDWPGKSTSNASVSQAVPLPGDHVLLSKGYSVDSQLLHVGRDPQGGWLVESVWQNKNVLRTKFTNVVVRDGFVYALSDGVLQCVEWATGRRCWKAGRYGHGQVLGVDDLLLVQAETGKVVLIAASPESPQVLGQLDALRGQTWNNPALYGHFLLVRNSEEATCFQLP